MKRLGLTLITIGIVMFVLGNVTFTRKEKVVDAGPIEINRKEKKTIRWPNYAGAIIVVAGVVVLLIPGKKGVDNEPH